MKQKFTYLKSIFKLTGVLTFALSTFNAAAQTTTIFSEDFSSITVGNNTTTTGSATAWTKNANFPTTWRTFQAGGALKLGNPTQLGYIQSVKTLDLSQNGGNFTVSFDVKGWDVVQDRLMVSVTGLNVQYITYTAKMSDGWEHVTLNYTGGKAKSQLSFETVTKSCFIDNILVTTSPIPNLAPPDINQPIDLEPTTFTASWGAVTGATKYLFDVGYDSSFATLAPGYSNVEVTGTSYNVTGMTANTQLYYRVRAVSATQTSLPSGFAEFKSSCLITPGVQAQSFCVNKAAKVSDLVATPAANAVVSWYSTEGGVALDANDVLTSGTYFVNQKIDDCESTRKPFDVKIVTVAAAEVANAIQTFCATSAHTVANLVATTTDAANTLQWYPDATTTNALTATTELKTGSYFVAQKLNDCESARKEVAVTVLSTDKPAGLEAQTFCSATAPTVASLAATALDTATLQWYADATSTDVLAATTAIKSGSYFVTQKLNDCESERKEIAVTVNTVTIPTGLEKQDFIEGQTLANLEVTANENLVWYSDAALTTILPKITVLTDDATYYAAEKIGDCTSAALAVTVNKVLATDNFDAVSFKFYPNPVNDVVTISYSKNITSVIVYNLVGQVVLFAKPDTTAAQINMSSLSSGYYMATIAAGNQSKTIKLIKQ